MASRGRRFPRLNQSQESTAPKVSLPVRTWSSVKFAHALYVRSSSGTSYDNTTKTSLKDISADKAQRRKRILSVLIHSTFINPELALIFYGVFRNTGWGNRRRKFTSSNRDSLFTFNR